MSALEKIGDALIKAVGFWRTLDIANHLKGRIPSSRRDEVLQQIIQSTPDTSRRIVRTYIPTHMLSDYELDNTLRHVLA